MMFARFASVGPVPRRLKLSSGPYAGLLTLREEILSAPLPRARAEHAPEGITMVSGDALWLRGALRAVTASAGKHPDQILAIGKLGAPKRLRVIDDRLGSGFITIYTEDLCSCKNTHVHEHVDGDVLAINVALDLDIKEAKWLIRRLSDVMGRA